MFLGYDWPRLHAALNDLPPALLLCAVLFDLAGWVLKRDSLIWAGIWTLWAGVIGGWAAVIAGELAEEKIEHGEAIHEIMKVHEKYALIAMGTFTAVLVWKLWRRFQQGRVEDRILKFVSLCGLAILIRTAQLGGQMVFDHAAGVPTAKLQAEIQNRAAGHHHEEGDADHDHDEDAAPAADTAHADSSGGHVHPPGTPAHAH
jgi:uncharacterized membrane protein